MSALFGILSSPIEWLVVAMVALLLFGNRLPSVMRSLGQGVVEFKKGIEGVEDDIDRNAKKKGDSESPSKKSEAEAPK